MLIACFVYSNEFGRKWSKRKRFDAMLEWVSFVDWQKKHMHEPGSYIVYRHGQIRVQDMHVKVISLSGYI